MPLLSSMIFWAEFINTQEGKICFELWYDILYMYEYEYEFFNFDMSIWHFEHQYEYKYQFIISVEPYYLAAIIDTWQQRTVKG